METVDNSSKVEATKLIVVPISAANVNSLISHFGMPIPKKYTVVLDATVASLDIN